MNILQVDSGCTSPNSVSRTLTTAIVDKLRSEAPAVTIIHRDLIAHPVPYMTLKTVPGSHPSAVATQLLSEEEMSDRKITDEVLNEFLRADVIVVGVPMYNFGVPAQLKSWVDAIVIPGKTFSYTKDGPRGLVSSKRAILAVTRGGCYGANGFPIELEHAESYLRTILSLIGITDPEAVLAEGVAHDRHAATERGRMGVRALAPLTMETK